MAGMILNGVRVKATAQNASEFMTANQLTLSSVHPKCTVHVRCNALNSANGPLGNVPTPSSGGQVRVPTSKELERMRHYRQQQQFRQLQQMRRNQRIENPSTPSGVPWQQASPTLPRQHQPLNPPSPQIKTPSPKAVSSPAKDKRPRRATPSSPDGGLSPAEFQQLADQCDLEQAWRPQVGLLVRLGLKAADLSRLVETRPEVFQTGEATMRRKLSFLRDTVGLSQEDLVKIVVKFPRILDYGSEQTVRPRLDLLRSLGVSSESLAKVVLRAPMIMSLSDKDTLEPRAAFLRDELALPEGGLGKLIARHPQVLTCSEDMMLQRVNFLRSECGLAPAEVARAVLAHPQVLHYKIDSMRERVDYLQRSVGMNDRQIAASVARFPQIFSLAVSSNLAPKWRYLVEHLGGGIAALCTYPGYLSLSLPNRIIPRHRYLQHLRGDSAPMPFPLGHLKLTDKKFAMDVAGTSLLEYEKFKEQVLEGAELSDSVWTSDDDGDDDVSSVGKDIVDEDVRGAWMLDASRSILPAGKSSPANGMGLRGLYPGGRGTLSLGPDPLVRRAHPDCF